MNKHEFISKVAEKADSSKVDAERIIDAVVETITEELANGGSVTFTGFGTFLVRERAERTGRNPRTNETITIPAQKSPAFKSGKNLKAAVK